jgi:ABC-type sugar transport system ATPase subunit
VQALLGGNGSGKSTLSKILGGTVRADSGEIFYGGNKLKITSPNASKKLGVVITSQELSLPSNLNVEENIMLCTLPRRGIFLDKSRLTKKAAEILERLKIAEYAKANILSLAPNQKYMVELAKAIVQEPKVLVIDEITSALYREDVQIVRDVVRELKENGCCILFISHRLNEIYDICDTVTVLRNGELVKTCSLSGVRESELLSLMTGLEMNDMARKIDSDNDAKREKGRAYISIKERKLKGFRQKLNLDIHKGEIIGIAGLQGNGQSGLVRSLFSLEGPIDLEIDGQREELSSPSAAVRRGFAFVSGEREKEGTFANRSIFDNISVVTDLLLKRSQSAESKAKVLREYNVRMKSPDQLIRSLSGGNQQKVVLARWTIAEPSLILADDPTKGIDVNARREVHGFIHSLARRGTSVLFVSSDDEELVELTKEYKNSRVIVMYDGGIVHTLTGEDITTKNIAYHLIPRGEHRA